MVHYHKAKLLCVAFFYILVIFHIKLDSNRSFVVGSAQYYQFRQVLTAHNKSRSTFHVLRSSRQNCHLWIFKPLKALWFTKSILTVSFDKHLMRFCSSFLQMVTENQCCPQIVVSRHKIRPVQRYYKLCCCMKPVLFWVENVCEMSTNFWHQWRSLVITTLSARAIYRQIPVSYLQTWYLQRGTIFALSFVGSAGCFLSSILSIFEVLIVSEALSLFCLYGSFLLSSIVVFRTSRLVLIVSYKF